MSENAPSLVCVAYPSQNYRPGRGLGDCPGKPPIFLTNEELSNETRVVVVFFLKLFSDDVMAFHICTCNGWRPSHSRGLPEKHPCRPGGGKPSPQAKAGLPPVFGNKGLLKSFTHSFLHCVCGYLHYNGRIKSIKSPPRSYGPQNPKYLPSPWPFTEKVC